MSRVKGRVWSTGRGKNQTWHYAVLRGDGAVVLYDNTGAFEPMLRAALIRVAALRHMEIAGHRLKPYKGDIG